jgi:hypothetical protein
MNRTNYEIGEESTEDVEMETNHGKATFTSKARGRRDERGEEEGGGSQNTRMLKAEEIREICEKH